MTDKTIRREESADSNLRCQAAAKRNVRVSNPTTLCRVKRNSGYRVSRATRNEYKPGSHSVKGNEGTREHCYENKDDLDGNASYIDDGRCSWMQFSNLRVWISVF